MRRSLQTEGNRPNVLFFLSDQHAFDCAGYASGIVDTPNLDALARDGCVFENTYCQNPLCVPSRSSLLTGRYSKNLGIYENRHILDPAIPTLPGIFAENGYRTCLIGKAHFNGDQYHGYQSRPYGDFLGQGHQPEHIRVPGEADESGLGDILENSGATAIPLPMTQTEICVAETVKYLQLQSGEENGAPFFLSVNFDKPHFPYRAPEALFEKYRGRAAVKEGPPRYAQPLAVEFVRKAFEVNGAWEHYGKDADLHRQAFAAYLACVEWIDDAIGRILRSLRSLGLAGNTIVVYASDHGEMAGDKGAWQKTVFFDRSAKVPLIIKYPSRFLSGAAVKECVGLIDLFPTLCEAAGIPAPAFCDGASLLDTLETGRSPARDTVFAESAVLKVPEHAGCMVRKGRYKYNYYLQGRHELYDMESDPGELRNLVGEPEWKETEKELRETAAEFWKPDEQIARCRNCPMSEKEKHFYLYSNQFSLPDGTLRDAKP